MINQNFYVGQIFYTILIAFPKLSMLLFYLRLFPSLMFKRLAYALFTFIALAVFIWMPIQIFQVGDRRVKTAPITPTKENSTHSSFLRAQADPHHFTVQPHILHLVRLERRLARQILMSKHSSRSLRTRLHQYSPRNPRVPLAHALARPSQDRL